MLIQTTSKPVLLLILLMAMSVTTSYSFDTNKVWSCVVREFRYTNASLPAVIVAFEEESKKVDPLGRGVRVIYPTYGSEPVISINITNTPLHEAIQYITEVTGQRFVIANDVALLFSSPWRSPMHSLGLHGACFNTISRTPVTNVMLSTYGIDAEVAVKPNGQYVAAVLILPHNNSWLGNLEYHYHDQDDEEFIIFASAPGYRTNVLKVSTSLQNWNSNKLDIPLDPVKKDQNDRGQTWRSR